MTEPPAAPPSSPPRTAFGSSPRDYLGAQLLGWGGLTLVSVLSSASGDLNGALRFAVAKTFCMGAGLGLSHLWRNYLRKHGWLERSQKLPLSRLAAGLLLISTVQTAILVGTDVLFRHGALLQEEHVLRGLVFLLFLWFIIFTVWTLCYAMVLSRRRAVRFELEKLELEVCIKDAELRAMQAQVNPHFFFNSLNSIRSLIYQDAETAAQAVTKLAEMMRHNLQAGQRATVSLAEELAAIEVYLGMEKLRFEERLQLSMQLEPGLEGVRLPSMALQTLVENAIKHGVEPSLGPCALVISAARQGGQVQVRVANQGRLTPTSASTRLGLVNVGKRLALLFGPAARCSVSEEAGWVVARLILPPEPT